MRIRAGLAAIAVLSWIGCSDVEPASTAAQAAALDEHTEALHVASPLTVARFTALTGRSDLAQLRLTLVGGDSGTMPDITVQAVTASDDDHYTIVVDGVPVRVALPGYKITGAQVAAIDADDPMPSPVTEAWLAAQQAQAAGLMANQWGGFADYQSEVQRDLGGPVDDPPEDAGDPGAPGGGAPPGGGGGSGGPRGGGPPAMPGGGALPGVAPAGAGGLALHSFAAGRNANPIVEFVCDTRWYSLAATFTATLITINRANVRLAALVFGKCAKAAASGGTASYECVVAAQRLAANKRLAIMVGISTALHGIWEGALRMADDAYHTARISEDKDAVVAGTQSRATAFKGLAISAVVLFAGNVGLTTYAAITSTTSVIAAVGSFTGASAQFFTCGYAVLNPKAQNDAVRVAINMDGHDGNVGGGGLPGTALAPPPPPPGGPGGPGEPGPVGTSDAQRHFMSNKMTGLPRALAMQNVMTIDLRSTVSPFTGQPSDNQIATYRSSSQSDAWGVGLCTVLNVDSDPDGPYQGHDPFTGADVGPFQPANTPYVTGGSPGSWGSDMSSSQTSVVAAQGMTERICDDDNDNNGIVDSAQSQPVMCRPVWMPANPDNTDGLVSMTVDSPQPNRAPDAHANCAHISMSLVPHPQDGDIPGLTAEQILPMVMGKWVGQQWIFSPSLPYKGANGASLGVGNSQLRFLIGGTLGPPDDPCLTYQKVIDPPWFPRPYHHEWVRDTSKPGCALLPPGEGMPPI